MDRIVKCASCSYTITVDEHSSIREYVCSERCANNNLWNKAKEYGREEGRREILEQFRAQARLVTSSPEFDQLVQWVLDTNSTGFHQLARKMEGGK